MVLNPNFWSAEQAASSVNKMTSSSQEPDSNLYTQALLYYETGEFKKCAFILQDQKDLKSIFLSGYSLYLSYDCSSCFQDESSLINKRYQDSDQYLKLYNDICSGEKDGFLEYL